LLYGVCVAPTVRPTLFLQIEDDCVARIDVIMPQMGESIAEGTVSRWLKKVGDPVKRDEALFEISTDKVDAEIPSPSAGILGEILVGEGLTVAIQTVVARLETDAAAAASLPASAPSAPAAVSPSAAVVGGTDPSGLVVVVVAPAASTAASRLTSSGASSTKKVAELTAVGAAGMS
jgi:2-oxoglutarate dehydrogenase E2 component (dihydrolipoamide succinyltransferase)